MFPPGELLHGDSLDGFTATPTLVDQVQVRCGLGCRDRFFSSHCLQRFATVRSFLTALIVLTLLQGAAQGYLSATAPVIARRFGFPTSFLDWLLVGSELSQGLLGLLVAFWGGRGHRPSWLGACVFLQAVCCLLVAVPQITHGARIREANVTIIPGREEWLCAGPENIAPQPAAPEPWWFIIGILVLAQLGAGIAVTSFMAHGLTYLDDNSEKTDSPSLLGAVLCARQLGPKLGEVLAYQCSALSGAVSGNLVSGNQLNGAWWLGWPVLATLLLNVALLIAMFPRRLPFMAVKEVAASILDLVRGRVQISEERQYILDAPSPGFCATVGRLLTNGMVLFNILAMVCMHIALTNFSSLEDRYLESAYHIPRPENSGGVFRDRWISRVTTGFLKPPIVGMALLVSGLLISRNRPRPSVLAAWNVLLALFAAAIFFIYTSLGCPLLHVDGASNGRLTLSQSCNSNCHCPTTTPFSPVCDKDGINTYYSPCHAGCTAVETLDDLKLYENCSCVPYGRRAKGGPCNNPSCTRKWVLYQSLGVLVSGLLGTGVVGNLLLCLRCVVPQDKPAVLGLELMLVGLLQIPGKLGYKALADSTCKHWGGNSYTCRLFQADSLVVYINVLTGCLLLLSAFFDCFVWAYSRRLKLYTDDDDLGASQDLEMDDVQRQKLSKRHATPAVRRRRKDVKNGGASVEDLTDHEATTRFGADEGEEEYEPPEGDDLLQADPIGQAVVVHKAGTLV